MDDFILKEKEEYWDNEITLKDYISRLKKYNYIDCSGNWDYEFHYIVENLEKLDDLQENYERIYTENCKLREQHNITDISLLDENYKLQQENERLRAINSEYERLNKQNGRGFTITNVQEYNINDLLDYKSRCEIASKLIQNWESKNKIEHLLSMISEVQRVLQGSDKE